MDNREIGTRIRLARRDAGLTQEKLAEKIGVSTVFVKGAWFRFWGILGIGEKTSATFIYDQKKFGLGITVTIFLESC